MQITLVRSEVVAPNVRTFWFRPDMPVRYSAGQFIELRVPHHQPDNRGEWRQFTLFSSPSEKLLGITVQFAAAAERSSSFKRALSALPPGAVLQATEPMGDFVLPKDTAVPLVFAAGGIGITPVRSILRWLRDTQERRDISVLFAARRAESALFDDFLREQPAMSYARFLSAEGRRLSAQDILRYAPPNKRALFYLSGPETFVENLAQGLAADVEAANIVSDPFTAYKML